MILFSTTPLLVNFIRSSNISSSKSLSLNSCLGAESFSQVFDIIKANGLSKLKLKKFFLRNGGKRLAHWWFWGSCPLCENGLHQNPRFLIEQQTVYLVKHQIILPFGIYLIIGFTP